MTKAQLMTLIGTLINDNNAKEISAQDVRDSLEAVYDTSILDVISEDEINTIIREYSTIVIQTLVDQKKPTRAEAIIAFKSLPHMDWAKNDTFYIRDSAGGNKMVFCTYISDGATDEATAGPIFYKDMNETV